ncbi:MAG TPA: methyltransferase domain-containing protein [Thermoanaerobaculia bacterium]
MTWNPDQYERFKAERRQPFVDLLSLVERRAAMRVVDLGCGTGELTRTLHEELGAASTLGIDSSSAMLSRATPSSSVRFALADIETFSDAPFDLIFSNAALHWIPDHESLIARLASLLAPGGQLAIQMPANDTHPSHTLAAQLAREYAIAPRADYVLPPERYATLLHDLGFPRQHVRLQIYGHVLDSVDGVVEWVRGALLTEYERQLPPDRWTSFLDEYRTRLRATLGDARPFFYTYKRVLMWGAR